MLSSPAGPLYLVRAGADDLVIRDPEPADRELLALLAGDGRSEQELLAAVPLEAQRLRGKLDDLERADLLACAAPSRPLDALDAERYARQLPYLAELGDASALQRRLRSSHVVVLGCGGLGTWAVAALASAGVGRFRLVDDDAVEVSNLNRQILYSPAAVDRPKVAATAAWLAAFDERIEVEALELRLTGPSGVAEAIEGADVVVVAADSPPYLLARWVNDSCLAAGVPFVTAGQMPPVLKVGPVYAPGRTACLRCHETQLRRSSPLYDEYVAQAQRAPSRGATMGPASGIVGTMVADEVLHLLWGVEPASLGAALIVDIRTLQVRREIITRDPDCPACHDHDGNSARPRSEQSAPGPSAVRVPSRDVEPEQAGRAAGPVAQARQLPHAGPP